MSSRNAVLSVVEPGPLTTLQDEGRSGRAATGVTASGALDRAGYRLANRLVGNLDGTAALEITFGGFRAVCLRDTWIAVTGADVPVAVDGRPSPVRTRIRLEAGQDLRIGPPRRGVRSYLAVRGGFTAPAVLGSLSTDTMTGIGPAPVRSGDTLWAGRREADFPEADFAPARRPTSGSPLELPAVPGPRDDWFSPSALEAFFTRTWTVDPSSNRVGVRLAGPPLERAVRQELPTEGMTLGAVQVPASGPIVFMDDHPVTGGYPVIAVVTRDGLDTLAQARAGDPVRFVRLAPDLAAPAGPR